MWVEKLSTTIILRTVLSSSLWGCELKRYISRFYINNGIVILLVRMWVENSPESWPHPRSPRHPPCEDVSWKDKRLSAEAVAKVILHVRMWVEKWICADLHPATVMSSSMWGCELKIVTVRFWDMVENVILLVRMWVEKLLQLFSWYFCLSSSMWGCELKKQGKSAKEIVPCHPPCEDVSWKDISITSLPNVLLSSSMWGCELKNVSCCQVLPTNPSSSMWGCELKSYSHQLHECK